MFKETKPRTVPQRTSVLLMEHGQVTWHNTVPSVWWWWWWRWWWWWWWYKMYMVREDQ